MSGYEWQKKPLGAGLAGFIHQGREQHRQFFAGYGYGYGYGDARRYRPEGFPVVHLWQRRQPTATG